MPKVDFNARERTYADRRAFVLSEGAIAMADQLREQQAAAAAVAKNPVFKIDESFVNGSLADNRRRGRLAETAMRVEMQRVAFLRALGETVFRAIPLDADEKEPYRTIVMEQTAQLAEAVSGHWNLSETGRRMLVESSFLVTNPTAPAGQSGGFTLPVEASEACALVSEHAEIGDLGEVIAETAKIIEERTVLAVVAAKNTAADTQAYLNENATGNKELDERRERVMLKNTTPSLMECLFMVNQRNLSESGGTVETTVLMGESVCQYVLVETLSALGVMPMNAAESDQFVKLLSRK